MFTPYHTGVDTKRQNGVRGREGAMTIRTAGLTSDKQRIKAMTGMSGRSQASKGASRRTDANGFPFSP